MNGVDIVVVVLTFMCLCDDFAAILREASLLVIVMVLQIGSIDRITFPVVYSYMQK